MYLKTNFEYAKSVSFIFSFDELLYIVGTMASTMHLLEIFIVGCACLACEIKIK